MRQKPLASTAGKFVKHVFPAALKPIRSLWHEILGFTFLLFAAVGIFKVARHPETLSPVQFAIIVLFIVVMTIYGVSSFLKARRISRS